MNAQIKMQMAIASNAFPREAVNQLMEFEKQKAFDELFIEHGVEEIQLQMAGDEYKLSEDETFVRMMQN